MKTNEKTNDEARNWYWIAVNGPTCASSAFPLPTTVQVSPTPEQLLGFSTREEQIAVQQFLLNGPIDDVYQYMTKTIPAKIKNGEVVYMRPSRPEPPTEGPTMWTVPPASWRSNEQRQMSIEATARIDVSDELGGGNTPGGIGLNGQIVVPLPRPLDELLKHLDREHAAGIYHLSFLACDPSDSGETVRITNPHLNDLVRDIVRADWQRHDAYCRGQIGPQGGEPIQRLYARLESEEFTDEERAIAYAILD